MLETDSGRIYLQFLGLASISAFALVALGWLPTVRLAGNAALPSMGSGIAVGLLASLAGSAMIWKSKDRSCLEAMPLQFGAMAVRLLVALVLAGAAVAAGVVSAKPFLLWLAIAHAALLIADTLFARTIALRAAAREARGA